MAAAAAPLCSPRDPRCLQVHHILNELVMGGMVLETNMSEIIARIEEQTRIEKQEVSQAARVAG